MNGQWAPDPHGRAELRYWDGQRWTDNVSNHGTAGIDHVQPPQTTGYGYVPTMPQQAVPQSAMMPLQDYYQAPRTQPAFQPPGYVQYNSGYPVRRSTSGCLIAAGIMTMLESAFFLIFGLWLVSVTTSRFGRFADDVTGGTLTFVAVVMIAIGAALLVGGIGSCMGRNWGRILVIVFNGIAVVLVLIGLAANHSSNSSNPAGILIMLGWLGAVIVLAAAGKPTQRNAMTMMQYPPSIPPPSSYPPASY